MRFDVFVNFLCNFFGELLYLDSLLGFLLLVLSLSVFTVYFWTAGFCTFFAQRSMFLHRLSFLTVALVVAAFLTAVLVVDLCTFWSRHVSIGCAGQRKLIWGIFSVFRSCCSSDSKCLVSRSDLWFIEVVENLLFFLFN